MIVKEILKKIAVKMDLLLIVDPETKTCECFERCTANTIVKKDIVACIV
jgi:hypothetical protein